MRSPVKNNCEAAKCSNCNATCVHETNIPTYVQFTNAWQQLTQNLGDDSNIPELVKQSIMTISVDLIRLHQQGDSEILLQTANSADCLQFVYAFFNQLTSNN